MASRLGAWWTRGKDKKQQASYSPYKLTKQPPLYAKIADDAKNCLISGLDLTWDGNIVIADRNNGKLKLLSNDGKSISALDLPDRPNDVAVTSASRIAVSQWQVQQVGIVKMTEADELKVEDTIKLDYGVWAITSFEDNLIITCTTETPSVKMITLGDDVLWSVDTTPDGTVLFDSPYFITSSPSSDGSRVVVSDMDKNTLIVLDGHTSKVEHVYDVEYIDPRGVALDDSDNIYCCYETGKISIRGRDADREICIADKIDGLTRLCVLEFNLKTNELMLSTSYVDTKANINDHIYRYKLP